jgi:hypothetical protein
MSFPPEIAERALLDCGRHCCLCHKFCGSKIELHHIVARADGGGDTYDNCIPLCFDCHAETRAYDPKHPKGRKFTVSELREHRNRWYEKVKNSQGVTISPDYLKIDRELFVKIREILPSTGAIELVRCQDYFGSFPRREHHDLHEFARHCETPEFEFLDADLESLRGELESHITKFLRLIGGHTFPLRTRAEFNRIAVLDSQLIQSIACKAKDEKHFEELKHKHEKHVNEVGWELNRLADEICKTYDELIRLGRRKLAV